MVGRRLALRLDEERQFLEVLSIPAGEGLQQLQQYQQNWITYRATCERLKHEKFLFAARAGPYASSEPEALLAERVESLVSQEHAAWVSQREEAARRVGDSR